MAKSYFTSLIMVSNILLLFNKCTSSITYILLFYTTIYFTFSIPITPSDDNQYLPSDNANITNLMVSQYDCEKQHNLRQFNILNVKQCTEAPSSIQHAIVQARVYVGAKAKRVRAFKCETYAKKERKVCFQGNVKYRHVDRTVWNHNTMPLSITFEISRRIRTISNPFLLFINLQNVYRNIYLYAC